MSKENIFFDEIKAGLEDAIAYHKGKKKLKTSSMTIEPVTEIKGKEIKKIRDRLLLTQKVFAHILGVSIYTIEGWESGRNIPNGSAQRILSALKKDPESLKIFGWSVVENDKNKKRVKAI